MLIQTSINYYSQYRYGRRARWSELEFQQGKEFSVPHNVQL
jgi:hypothetical protein